MHVFRLTDDLLHGRLFVRHLSLPLIRACSLLIGAYRSSSGSLNIESPTVDVFRCYRHQKKKTEKYNKRKKWNNFQPPFRFNLSLDFCSNKLILYFKLLPQTQFARAQSSCLYFHLAQETLPINIYASFFFLYSNCGERLFGLSIEHWIRRCKWIAMNRIGFPLQIFYDRAEIHFNDFCIRIG